MLSALKQYTSGWVAQVFIGLMVVSFAVWGIADIFTGFGAGEVVTVGKTEVTVRDYQRRYDDSLRAFQRQLGQPITNQQAAQFGVPAQVLSILIAEATLDDAGREMGLGMSNDMLSQQIRANPAFVSPGGTFSQGALQEWVTSRGMTLDEFVLDRRDEYVRRQITDAFSGSIEVPDAYMQAFQEFSSETRTISQVTVPPDPLQQIAEPTDAELVPFYNERMTQWRAPEYRALRYFALTREAISRPGDITDAEAQKRYDDQIARFSAPERRTIDQIVFDSAEDAAAAADAISSGAAFQDVAAERNLTQSDLRYGPYTKAEAPDSVNMVGTPNTP